MIQFFICFCLYHLTKQSKGFKRKVAIFSGISDNLSKNTKRLQISLQENWKKLAYQKKTFILIEWKKNWFPIFFLCKVKL